MKLHSDLSDINFNDFIFTAVEINDTYNARLIGPVKNYCWGNDCSFPSLKGFKEIFFFWLFVLFVCFFFCFVLFCYTVLF